MLCSIEKGARSSIYITNLLFLGSDVEHEVDNVAVSHFVVLAFLAVPNVCECVCVCVCVSGGE